MPGGELCCKLQRKGFCGLECNEVVGKVHTQGDGTVMPRTGVWVDPETGRWGMIRPMSDKARRLFGEE